LKPEKAINLSGGFTSALSPHLNITVDGYWIQIKNRIVLSGTFDKTNPYVSDILLNYPNVDQVQFITNAVNTRTHGIDIVMNGSWKVQKASVGFMLAVNFTRTNLFGAIQTADKLPADSLNTNTLFNQEEREKMEHGQPASKIILSANYKKEKIGFLIRCTQFGRTSIAPKYIDPISGFTEFLNETFSPKILTDLSFIYPVKKWLALTAGVNNVFDVYPDPVKNPINQNQGILIYSNQGTPYGYNGGYYYLTMDFSW
jgi:iron complex outermembrane receptor protein